MPELKDAIAVVTDPANIDTSTDTHSEYRRVNQKRAMAALRAMGAGKGTARALISDAVREIDGRVESEVVSSGRAAGSDAKEAGAVWYVPVAAIGKG